MELRDYQQVASDKIFTLLNNKRSPILAAPTGSGKTVIGTNLVARFIQQGAMLRTCNRVLWIAHRKELIDQAYTTLSKACIGGLGVIMADDPREKPKATIQVASIQTLVRRDYPDVDLVVVDEAHHARGAMYHKVLSYYQQKGVPCLGLTATPFRLDGKGLGVHFTDIVTASTTFDLCQDGFLMEPIVYAPVVPNMAGIAVRAGDYALNASSAVMRQPSMIKAAVDAWEKLAKGRKTVVNAVDVAHSQDLVAEFKKRGYKFAHLDANTPRGEREKILADLAASRLVGVANCMILSEGWDLPSLEVCLNCRPTASLCLHLQQIGRIMRAALGKGGAMVIDCAGNHRRHGFVTEKFIFSLKDVVKRQDGKTVPGIKECPDCKLVLQSRTAECPDCGYKFTNAPASLPPAKAGSLGRLVPIDKKELARMGRFWAKLELQAQSWGRKQLWKVKRFEENFGCEPMVVNGQVLDPLMASQQQRAAFYVELLLAGEAAGYKIGAAYHRYVAAVGSKPDYKWAPPHIRSQILKMFRAARR